MESQRIAVNEIKPVISVKFNKKEKNLPNQRVSTWNYIFFGLVVLVTPRRSCSQPRSHSLFPPSGLWLSSDYRCSSRCTEGGYNPRWCKSHSHRLNGENSVKRSAAFTWWHVLTAEPHGNNHGGRERRRRTPKELLTEVFFKRLTNLWALLVQPIHRGLNLRGNAPANLWYLRITCRSVTWRHFYKRCHIMFTLHGSDLAFTWRRGGGRWWGKRREGCQMLRLHFNICKRDWSVFLKETRDNFQLCLWKQNRLFKPKHDVLKQKIGPKET